MLFLLRYLDTLDTARDFSLSDPFEHKRKMASPPGAAEALEKIIWAQNKNLVSNKFTNYFSCAGDKTAPRPAPEATLSWA